jgi:hypothetical protein
MALAELQVTLSPSINAHIDLQMYFKPGYIRTYITSRSKSLVLASLVFCGEGALSRDSNPGPQPWEAAMLTTNVLALLNLEHLHQASLP